MENIANVDSVMESDFTAGSEPVTESKPVKTKKEKHSLLGQRALNHVTDTVVYRA